MFRETFQKNCHETNTSNPIQSSSFILLIGPLVLSSNQYVAAHSVQWLVYTLEGLKFKSWHEQENYLFSRTSRPAPAPAPTQPPTQLNHSFISGSKVARADSLTTHIRLEPSLKSEELYLQSTCLSPWHILGQPNFTFTTYLCTSLSSGHIISSLI